VTATIERPATTPPVDEQSDPVAPEAEPAPAPAGTPDRSVTTRRPRRRLPAGELAAGVLAVAGAGVTFTDVLLTGDVLAPVLAAAGMPVVVAAVVRLRPRPHLALAVLAQAVAMAVAAAATVFPATAVARVIPTGSTLGAMADAVGRGWRDILGATVPAPARPAALFVPFALVFVASMVTAELVLRTRRVLLAAVPALALAAAGLAFGAGPAGDGGFSGSWGAGPVVLVGLCVVGLLALRGTALAADPRPHDARVGGTGGILSEEAGWALRRQRLTVALPFVLIVTVVAVPLGRLLPVTGDDGPLRLRELLTIEHERDRDLNPLTRLAVDRDGQQVRYRLRLSRSGAPPPDLRVRLAVLDRYDGVQWTSPAERVIAGPRLPAPEGTGTEVTYEVEVVDPAGPWLPTLERPSRLTADVGVDVRVDPLSGSLDVPGSPPTGFRYAAVSNVPVVDREALQHADVATTEDARAAVATNDELPPELAELRSKVTDRATSPYTQLALLQLFLDNDPRVNDGRRFTLDPAAAPGFTIGHINRFLSPNGARAGRAEQFAAAFAVLARSLGLPARVVVGFAPGAAPAPGTTLDLRAGQLTAWPEVALAGAGWVPFDVVPDDRSDRTVTVDEQDLRAQSADAGSSTTGEEPPPVHNPNLDPVPPPEEAPDSRSRVLVALALVILLGGSAFLVSPWVRRRRRRARRRRAADAAARVDGAWCEALDRLVEQGETGVTARTTPEATAAVEAHFGPEPATAMAELGRLHAEAMHAPSEPSAELGEQAWRCSEAVVRGARDARTRRQRLRAALDRRPLSATTRAVPVGAGT
jgi:transglutaminase-like putative cysteine protease